MRIEGKKPEPSNLAEILQDIEGGEAGTSEEVEGFGMTVAEPVVTSPMTQRAEKRLKIKIEPYPKSEPALEPTPEPVVGRWTAPGVESDIPIPPHGNVGTVRYPFRAMEPGQSFEEPAQEGETRKKLSARVRSASAQFRRRSKTQVTFTTRMTKKGIRVWRVT